MIINSLLLLGALTFQTTPPPVVGQTAILQWDQAFSAADTVLPPTYEYRLIVDAKPDVLVKQTCAINPTVPTQYICEAPLPALPTGGHQLTLFARINVGGTNYAGGVSLPLPVISLLIEVPQNLRKK